MTLSKHILLAAGFGVMLLPSAPVLAQPEMPEPPEVTVIEGPMFQKMDANNDGSVTRDEFMALHMEKFDAMDADDDGTISGEEMRTAQQKRREAMRTFQEQRMKKMQEYRAEMQKKRQERQKQKAEDAPAPAESE